MGNPCPGRDSHRWVSLCALRESPVPKGVSPTVASCYTSSMLIGAHVLLYSDNPEADRAFFRDVLQFPAVDSGGGWLIFKLPTAEAGVHPIDKTNRQMLHGGHRQLGAVLYLMCDDLAAQVKV